MTSQDLTQDPALVELAHTQGVATEYWDWQGRHVLVRDEDIRAILAAMGVDASTEASSEAALQEARTAPWRRTLAPTTVTRQDRASTILVHVPHGSAVHVEAVLEDGTTRSLRQVEHNVAPRWVDGVLVGEAGFEVPADLPLGWHELVTHPEREPMQAGTERAVLVVTPARLQMPAALTHRRAVGVAAQLYQARSRGSWGIGDLHDLTELGVWAADEHGCDYVLVNPLHAASPVTPVEASPYRPATRRFLWPIYVRVEDIPEASRLDPAAAARLSELAEAGRALDGADTVDRDAVWRLKREALGLVHAAGLSGARARDLACFVREEGEGLQSYATWCALAEEYGEDWSQWPQPLRDAGSEAVRRFAAEHRDSIDLHLWLQWVVARQLRAAQRALTDAGMGIGVMEDLAVGVHPRGSETWSMPDVYAQGVTVGAPPDQFNQLGQRWDQPPMRPDRLAQLHYRPFRDLVRAALRDSGGVRIDHIIGLFRLWWLPEGGSPADGTYVRYDDEAMIGILVLEAQRAGAVVVGEDLGVVEPRAREVLLDRGLLGTSILWFEWEGDAPRAPEHYRKLCLSSVTTHDLPPTAGYLALDHVAIRERLGLLTRSAEQERALERASIEQVRKALVARGFLTHAGDAEAMLVALHRWLGATPSQLVAIALADIVGDRRAVNQPGTDTEYPNWRIPLTDGDGRLLPLDEIVSGRYDALMDRLVDAVRG